MPLGGLLGGLFGGGAPPPGRSERLQVAPKHFVLGTPVQAPFPEGVESVVFGTGCLWGTEKGFWRLPGVFATSVGYCAGATPNPTYNEVCSGATGHNEVVRVAYDPAKVSFTDLLRNFWQSHDPTQGNGQGFLHRPPPDLLAEPRPPPGQRPRFPSPTSSGTSGRATT